MLKTSRFGIWEGAWHRSRRQKSWHDPSRSVTDLRIRHWRTWASWNRATNPSAGVEDQVPAEGG